MITLLRFAALLYVPLLYRATKQHGHDSDGSDTHSSMPGLVTDPGDSEDSDGSGSHSSMPASVSSSSEDGIWNRYRPRAQSSSSSSSDDEDVNPTGHWTTAANVLLALLGIALANLGH